jgi:hypothetical protein
LPKWLTNRIKCPVRYLFTELFFRYLFGFFTRFEGLAKPFLGVVWAGPGGGGSFTAHGKKENPKEYLKKIGQKTELTI